MYKIGELSKLCNVSVKTLRYYESKGLLYPDEVDTFTGYRYYSGRKIDECNRIIALKELGFTLDEIKVHLQAKHSSDILDIIRTKEKELNVAKTQIEDKLRWLDSVKEMIETRDDKIFNVIIRIILNGCILIKKTWIFGVMEVKQLAK